MKEVVVYEWGRTHHKVQAQLVGNTIESITQREGLITPRRLVDEAKPASSPLHSLFTWNNTVAATKWREQEARQVINSLVVTYKRGEESKSAPAFVSVGHTKATGHIGEGYRPIAVVAADRDMANEALQEALSRLQALRSRYDSIEALAPVWDALDQIAA